MDDYEKAAKHALEALVFQEEITDACARVAAMSSHDGSAAWRVIVTPVRVVCANTQRLALQRARASYAIKHTRSAKGKIAQARQALGIVFTYCDAFEAAAEQLINRPLAKIGFLDIIDQVWPVDPDAGKRATTNRSNRNMTLMSLFCDADTQAEVRGTRWAGLQAITEYLDHYTPAKNPDVRATCVLTSVDLAAKKQRAYELLAV